MTFDQLNSMEIFSRNDFYDAYKEKNGVKTGDALEYALRKAVENGSIVRIGRNQYSCMKAKRPYVHSYSSEANRVAQEIQKEYPAIDFRIFELTQLNPFVNHLFAHNSIFVSVENEAVEYVFDTLRVDYPGRVMLKPKAEEYFRYRVDDQIVITRLPSESPKGADVPWHCRLEKMLVDVKVDKLLSQIVSPREYDLIYEEAFERYLVDVNAMYRYARRKGAVDRLITYANEFKKLRAREKDDYKGKLQ